MTLAELLKKLDTISKVIQAGSSKPLSFSQKAKEKELMERLEFRLNELVEKSKIEEAKIKIEIFEQIAELLK